MGDEGIAMREGGTCVKGLEGLESVWPCLVLSIDIWFSFVSFPILIHVIARFPHDQAALESLHCCIIGGGITDGESKPKSKEWFPYDSKMVRVPVATLSHDLALRLSI
jgi:hypothetical protein